MDSRALYDVLLSFKDIHKVVLNLADGLNDEQLNWKPEDYSTSIGFHLWHLGRESDYLKAALLQHYPLIGSDLGDANEIWVDENLQKQIERIRLNLLVFLTHDCRHLGMMECLKGLQTPHASRMGEWMRAGQTGFGSATEER